MRGREREDLKLGVENKNIVVENIEKKKTLYILFHDVKLC